MEQENFFFLSSKELHLLQSELLLIIGWFLTFVFLLFSKKISYHIPRILTFLVLLTNIVVLATSFPTQEVFFWKNFFYQNWFTQSLKISISFFALVACIVQTSYKNTLSEWFVIVLGAVLSAEFLISSASVVGLYVTLEMLSICGYLLVAFFSKDETMRSYPAAFNYLLFGSVSSACLIYGFSWLYGLSQSFYLKDIITVSLVSEQDKLLFFGGLLLVLGGFLFKLAIVPFHFWISEVYTKASSAVALFLATVPKIALSGVVVYILSLFTLQSKEVQEIVFAVLATLASLTVVGGALLAIQQMHLKRLFAYSGVSQMGFLMVLLLFPDDFSKQIILIFWLFYGFANIIVWKFSATIAVQTRHFELDKISFSTTENAILTTAALSLAGLPPFGGFIVKLVVFLKAWKHYEIFGNIYGLLLISSISLATLFGFFYYLKLPYFLFFKNKHIPLHTKLSNSSKAFLFVLVIINIGLVLFGLKFLV